MKSLSFSLALGFGSTLVYSAPSPSSGWQAPGPNDVRAPCPMLNTLANHGFLPHDGKGITVNKTIDALGSALNIDANLSTLLFGFAATTNPQPNATFFDLDHLSRHNILEHDASLSRQDSYFGPADVFNEAVFNQTKSFWTGDIIDVQMAANARIVRLLTSNLTNPEYSLSDLGSAFSIGESAAYIGILGDKKSATVPKSWVEYLFENERLPYELGFKRPNDPFTTDDLGDLSTQIINAQHFPQSPGKVEKRGDTRCPYGYH
ncbi:Cloroperoxidase [Hypoxylon sp. EC38]|uniref:Cloroperoxidase n=1 Tax=Hypoxylon sp. (strain EC38) TaxID=1001937 RepID=A0ACD6BA37_HYPS8|nr:Chain A, Peroxygenase [Hypoxylon sp. EC38]7O1X_A Chain A, Peroxygenase [Hypoxylon sp. EC38]7O1Z_A Chain A, Peroxygenase [Hypoxylon sp. EC38]7O2D_A Chain A, Peroxygenase [Hypoxylon sp. EC38]7O2G_A Chain A, Peroxygenase [Hypoxylon sp. EC38]OTA57433.1 Cloroperoxidase [Hypoxylon sp. EC38]